MITKLLRRLVEIIAMDDRSGTSYGNPHAKSAIDFAASKSFPYREPTSYDDSVQSLDDVLEDPVDIDRFVKKIGSLYLDADPYTPRDMSSLADDQLRMYEDLGLYRSIGHPSSGIDKTITIAPGRGTGTKRGYFSRPVVDSPGSLIAVMRLYDIPADDDRAIINADLGRHDVSDSFDDVDDSGDDWNDISNE